MPQLWQEATPAKKCIYSLYFLLFEARGYYFWMPGVAGGGVVYLRAPGLRSAEPATSREQEHDEHGAVKAAEKMVTATIIRNRRSSVIRQPGM
jgi:hypothetical protein